jgi:hypothetical protein
LRIILLGMAHVSRMAAANVTIEVFDEVLDIQALRHELRAPPP